MKNLIGIYSLLAILSGCASVTPVAAVIGAGAATTTAYYSVKSADATHQIIFPECVWYRKVKLSDEGKAGLTRDDKEQVATNNINYDKLCHHDN